MEIYEAAQIIECPGGIKIFRLAPISGKNIDFKPGQFVMLHLLDKSGQSIDKRPYSVASAPGDERIELAIKNVNGRFTSKLWGLKAGERVGVEGPFGHFVFNNEKKAVFIAGGVGITPLLSMLRHIARNNLAGDYFLLYSCKTKNAILYEEELKKLSRAGIKIKIFLTRETSPVKEYEIGRMDADKIRKHIKNPEDYIYFMCGPLAMITALKENLMKIGVPESSIKFEGWG